MDFLNNPISEKPDHREQVACLAGTSTGEAILEVTGVGSGTWP